MLDEEVMIRDETMEGHEEAETYEQKAGGSEEEPVDEEDYNIEGVGMKRNTLMMMVMMMMMTLQR